MWSQKVLRRNSAKKPLPNSSRSSSGKCIFTVADVTLRFGFHVFYRDVSVVTTSWVNKNVLSAIGHNVVEMELRARPNVAFTEPPAMLAKIVVERLDGEVGLKMTLLERRRGHFGVMLKTVVDEMVPMSKTLFPLLTLTKSHKSIKPRCASLMGPVNRTDSSFTYSNK